MLPWEIWQNIWKFWPVLLILFGIELVIGRKSSPKGLIVLLVLIFLLPILLVLNPLAGNPLANNKITFDKPLAGLTRSQLEFDLPVINLKLSSLPADSGSVIKGSLTYSQILPKPKLGEENHFGQVKYTFLQPQKYIPFLNNLGNSASLEVSRLIPHEINIKSNTGVFNLNFTDLKIDLLEIDSAAGQIYINFSANSSTKAYIHSEAGIISLQIPSGVGASIKTDSTFKSFKIDEKRFTKANSIYKSSNWGTAISKVEIEISGQATALEIK